MLLGRWSSDAFLCCIRKVVQEFSNSVSSMMIEKERFFTISDSMDITAPSCTGSRNNIGADFNLVLTSNMQ